MKRVDPVETGASRGRTASFSLAMARMTQPKVAVVSLGVLVLVGLVDYLTGYELAFSIFYLGPVALATWYGGRQMGVLFATLSAVTWLGVDLMAVHPYSHPAIPLWNTLVRLGFFILVTLLLDARRKTETELRAAKIQAETASKAKNAFLAGVSHELRTPLNAIIGYAALMVEEGGASGQLARDAGKIERASRHLLHLINNVLDFSKIEAGRLELFIEDVSIPEVLEDVRIIVDPILRRNRNTLVIECAPEARRMVTDGGRLRQILFNLTGNATKFTTDGDIRISVTRDDEDFVCFEIADSGIGMSPDELARVFLAFTQASAETHRRFGGSGLGLTISRLLCEALGGTIAAESAVGQGSRFVVRLPLQSSVSS